jgi:hypothetical protein
VDVDRCTAGPEVRGVGRPTVSDDDLQSAFSSTKGTGNLLTLLVPPLPAL